MSLPRTGRLGALGLALAIPAATLALALAPASAASASTAAGPSASPFAGLGDFLSAATGSFGGYASIPNGYNPRLASNSLYNLESGLGIRQLWSANDTGQGVGVALVDSGVASVAGLSDVVNGPDLSSTAGTDAAGTDGFGHGTHLAGIIAGHDGTATGAALGSSSPSQFEGVAPDATLVNIKVAEADGWSDPSRVIAGIAWAIQHKNDPGLNIRVINLSYGTDSTQAAGVDPLAYAAEQAWKAGIVVVASVGNNGTMSGRLSDPAIDPYVIAVGASNSTSLLGGLASFSQSGDGARNPDLTAPGNAVQSLMAPGSTLAAAVATAHKTSTRYLTGSGTSQAAAMVTGMVALMLQRNPALTPDQVKAMLVRSTVPLLGVSALLGGRGIAQVAAAEVTSVSAASAAQTFPLATGNGSLDGSRGSESWLAAGATQAEAENSALGGDGKTGLSWANAAWAGRMWAGSNWATADGETTLEGRSWAGRSWA